MGAFHVAIFALHLGGAVLVTAVWHARRACDVISRMYVDTWEHAPNSTALWVRDGFDPACYSDTSSRACYSAGLPVYEVRAEGFGWHLLALLAHFEWISAGFALYYVESKLGWLQTATAGLLPVLGALLCTPFGDSFAAETFLMWFNSLGSAAIIWTFASFVTRSRRVHPEGLPVVGSGRWCPADRPEDGLLPVLRFGEYCFSASELIVALTGVFVVDPPLFIPVLAYVGILACNLSGVVLHLAVVANSDRGLRLRSAASEEGRVRLQVPSHWVRDAPPPQRLGAEGTGWAAWAERFEYDWSNRASFLNTGLADSWVAYAVGLSMVCYQAQLLFSQAAPAFVVASGWILLLSYTSFGIWVTVMYLTSAPRVLARCCACVGQLNDTELLIGGLDVLSVNAKLGIVLSLTAGFVFMPGAC